MNTPDEVQIGKTVIFGNVKLEHRRIRTNAIELHVMLAGPDDGQPVFLLHGFPDFWFGWRPQIEALAEKGYRVIAPDLRGYNLSDKPRGVVNYGVEVLAADVVAIADALDLRSFDLVGHDLGGLLTWWIAGTTPDRLKSATILCAPHPAAFQRAMRAPAQWRKSWYMFFFQLPLLPEAAIMADNFRSLESVMTVEPGFSRQDMEKYRRAWQQPGALTGMLNWYRGFLRQPPKTRLNERIEVPLMLAHCSRDPVLTQEMSERSLDRCADARLVILKDTGHFPQRQMPEQVVELILEQLEA